MRSVGIITTPTRGIPAGATVHVEPDGEGVHLYVIDHGWDVCCDSVEDAEAWFSEWNVEWSDAADRAVRRLPDMPLTVLTGRPVSMGGRALSCG
jgi:hypothetical protein